MSKNGFFNASLYYTGIVSIVIWSLLAWQHYHGGVPRHHILHREDLPSISNWWNGLLLPLLTWFLLYRIRNRLIRADIKNSQVSSRQTNILYGFAGALFFGILLSIIFTFGYSSILGYLIIGLLFLGLFLPIYRAECLLGFVIGMTFTFGTVLPTVFGSILVLLSAILFLYVRPAVSNIFRKSPNR